MEYVSFTQPYLDSGIVLLTPAVGVRHSFPGVVFAPFKLKAWLLVIASILVTCVAMLLIECHEQQRDLRRLSLLERVCFAFRFFISVPLFFMQEPNKSPRSKFVLRAWTLFILLVGSSYTASLSSILTVNELSSDIKSVDDLKSKNLAVVYQSPSFVKGYLNQTGITNLVELRSEDDYANAIRTRQVAAIAEESPYVSLFLADQPASNCKFLVSPKLSNGGFGFAFRDENLASAFSVAILNLSESGQLRRLQDGWKLADVRCSSQIKSTQLDPKSAMWLFILLVISISICVILFGGKILWSPDPARARQGKNQEQDAVATFWEPGVRGILRRWSFS